LDEVLTGFRNELVEGIVEGFDGAVSFKPAFLVSFLLDISLLGVEDCFEDFECSLGFTVVTQIFDQLEALIFESVCVPGCANPVCDN